MTKLHATCSALAISAVLTTLPISVVQAEGAAPDNGGLEEVVVTAQKTGATALQKTPIAVSAFSEADLKNSLTNNVKDLAEYAAVLNADESHSKVVG